MLAETFNWKNKHNEILHSRTISNETAIHITVLLAFFFLRRVVCFHISLTVIYHYFFFSLLLVVLLFAIRCWTRRWCMILIAKHVRCMWGAMKGVLCLTLAMLLTRADAQEVTRGSAIKWGEKIKAIKVAVAFEVRDCYRAETAAIPRH